MVPKRIFQVICLLIVITVLCSAKEQLRSKRAAYELPSGIEFYIGNIQTTFTCSADGYYADVDNGCLLFHICHTYYHADGNTELAQFTFACGNQTVFNQLSFTCSHEEESIPCQSSPDFFYLNERLGVPTQNFHTEDDLARAAPLISGRASVRQPVAQRPQPKVPQVQVAPRIPEQTLPPLPAQRPPPPQRAQGQRPRPRAPGAQRRPGNRQVPYGGRGK